MIKILADELEEFYQDHDKDINKNNFKLLIDEWDGIGDMHIELETFAINPVLNTEEGFKEIDIKKELKPSNKKNLF